MAKNLLIVESPAKAKTIEGYLGKDFMVKSSYGHIRDLKKDDSAIEVNNNFKQHYEISADKKQLVTELKKLAKDAEMVWLASDEDREGEAISWHLFESLGLKEENTKRIVFHEITKPAILKAIDNPRKINYDLVNAQQARRVLDRLVGFELSPVLWKKVKPSLSAGRVQSVAVRLIVDREREINAFESTSAYRVVAVFSTAKKEIFKADLSQKFDKQQDAEAFLKDCLKASFEVNSLDVKPLKRGPAAPFTTSTLQQEASRKLGFSVTRTMTIAQKLYETGKITYMRTDSVNLSDTAIAAASAEIKSAYGDKYLETRRFKTKSAGAQEAHEAIRPTHFEWHTLTDGDASEKRLYELIWKRAIASQMSEAQLEKTTAKILQRMGDLLDATWLTSIDKRDGHHTWVVSPRSGTISPWASKATDIAHNCGLQLKRIERITEFHIQLKDGLLSKATLTPEQLAAVAAGGQPQLAGAKRDGAAAAGQQQAAATEQCQQRQQGQGG